MRGRNHMRPLTTPFLFLSLLVASGGSIAAQSYLGYVDVADCAAISGWVWDGNNADRVVVQIYDGGTLIATTTANQFRPDLAAAGFGDGSHAFSVPSPQYLALGTMQHNISVRVQGSSYVLVNSPKPSFTCYNIGFFEWITASQMSGWAELQTQPNSPISVDIYDGGTLLQSVSANQFRQDLYDAGWGNGYHVFSPATPSSLVNGSDHTVSIRYSGTNIDLTGSPKVFNQAAPQYAGWLDVADCSTLSGWAYDASRPTTPINVSFYDGNTGTPFLQGLASTFRLDLLNAGIGDGSHGYSFATPAILKDGATHTVWARYESGGINLWGTPKTVSCATPQYYII